jgi:phosphoribosylanthranilate isomerase
MAAVRIKFCGLTRPEDVRAALDLGVDALGFNLAKGPRRISVERARELAALAPPFVTTVALFVDADEATILAAMAATRCQAAQLHGGEPAALAARIQARFPVVKAFAVRDRAAVEAMRGYPADAYLLDAPPAAGLTGGTGAGWDHGLIAGVEVGRPVVLAGGLRAENVAAAIASVRPWAVDVSSGIEAVPGIKDPVRMRAFVEACRGAR